MLAKREINGHKRRFWCLKVWYLW